MTDAAHFQTAGAAELVGRRSGDALVDEDQFQPLLLCILGQIVEKPAVASFSCEEAAIARAANGSPVLSTAMARLAPFVAP